jgi:DUF4097 and DUF4098 domain-containing protein YvlB
MKLTSTCLLVAALAAGAIEFTAPVVARQQGDQVTIPFSDPARIGHVAISTLNGQITVKGANRRDVLVETRSGDDADADCDRASDRRAGLRKLRSTAGFDAVEENNKMVISARSNDDADITVYVPMKTNLSIRGTNGGEITVDGVEGEIEVVNTNDSIILTNVAGSVVANTTNGDIKATVARVTPNKAMAFASFNGDVDVTLPAAVKATFRLRSDMGDIYTSFDLERRAQAATQSGRREGGAYRVEVNQSIVGAVNGGGPDIELRTFEGDVYLRKAGQ